MKLKAAEEGTKRKGSIESETRESNNNNNKTKLTKSSNREEVVKTKKSAMTTKTGGLHNTNSASTKTALNGSNGKAVTTETTTPKVSTETSKVSSEFNATLNDSGELKCLCGFFKLSSFS